MSRNVYDPQPWRVRILELLDRVVWTLSLSRHDVRVSTYVGVGVPEPSTGQPAPALGLATHESQRYDSPRMKTRQWST